ncbi:MAG: thiamine phosphate synthase [Proteobacteria bacterium]|nr:thiamine phosphate synthase [Pseudomonadota bacterium]
MKRPRLPEPPLLVITDRTMTNRPLAEMAEAVFKGGCRWLMLREKDLDAAARDALAAEIIAVAKPYGAHVTINRDYVEGADGVHLPQGCPVERDRGGLIGVSAHSHEEAQRAADAGADYVTLCPVFITASKPGYGPALGLDELGKVASRLAIPIIALGGIDADNAAACLEAGAKGVAVMGAVMAAADPEGVVAGLVEKL